MVGQRKIPTSKTGSCKLCVCGGGGDVFYIYSRSIVNADSI